MVIHHLREILLVFNFFAVDGDDQVAAQHDGNVAQISALGAAVQSGQIGRASGSDLDDQQSVIRGQAHFVSQFRADRNRADAQSWPPHPAQRHQIVQHRFRRIDRNREADARHSARRSRESSC